MVFAEERGTVKNHTVRIMDRGGQILFRQLVNLERVRWGRVRDDISDAAIRISGGSFDAQREWLARIHPMRHELCIYRGTDRVWEGPITLKQDGGSYMELHAKDVMHYANRTAMHAAYTSAHPAVEHATTRAKRILDAELARKEALSPAYNVKPHIVEHYIASGARTTPTSPRCSRRSTRWPPEAEWTTPSSAGPSTSGTSIKRSAGRPPSHVRTSSATP
jgi:hypothetical protein